MPNLVAVRQPTPRALLAAIDRVWADGDAALPLPSTAPAGVVDGLVARLRPAVLRDGDHDEVRFTEAPPVPDGVALVVGTSGSTGVPKGVVLEHDALAASVASSRERLGAADGVPWLGVLPLNHVAGITLVLRSRAAGREPELHTRDTPELLATAEPSWISLVPAQLRRLLAADAGSSLARHHGVLLGGAAAPPRLLAAAADQGVHVVVSYGSTETCGGCVYDGVPLDDVEVRITDEGLLAVRGPVLARGRRRPGGTITPLADADGWWTSPDRGELDADGRVVVLGRADDVVISGGENVPLPPVRRAVRALPMVAASGVVGLEDEEWGTAVTAVVVPVANAAAPSLDEVRTALTPSLVAAHRPTRLVLTDELPQDRMGKLTPTAVREAIERGTAWYVQ